MDRRTSILCGALSGRAGSKRSDADFLPLSQCRARGIAPRSGHFNWNFANQYAFTARRLTVLIPSPISFSIQGIR